MNFSTLSDAEFRKVQNVTFFKILSCAAFWLLVIVWPGLGIFGLYVVLSVWQRVGWCFLLIEIPLLLWLIQIGVKTLLNYRHMDIFIYPRIRTLLLDWRMSRNSARQLPVECGQLRGSKQHLQAGKRPRLAFARSVIDQSKLKRQKTKL